MNFSAYQDVDFPTFTEQYFIHDVTSWNSKSYVMIMVGQLRFESLKT